jgi:tripartite-type tricarboxylate transporter receptor subunit TctC
MRFSRVLLLTAAALSVAAPAAAQPYPSKPIRLVVPFTPGSASDILARLIAPKLLASWGQQVVVDDWPSAGGTVAGYRCCATPDGHTLMLTSSGFAAPQRFTLSFPMTRSRILRELRRSRALRCCW